MQSKVRTSSRRGFVRVVLVAVIAGLVVGLAAPGAQASLRERDAMKRVTNSSRLANDIHRVRLNAAISDLARRHSLKMARRGELFHTADPSSHYLKGIRWNYWGENVGVTGGTVKDLQRAFMASSGHRHNVLNRAFHEVAIGAVRRDGILWVTVFFYG